MQGMEGSCVDFKRKEKEKKKKSVLENISYGSWDHVDTMAMKWPETRRR